MIKTFKMNLTAVYLGDAHASTVEEFYKARQRQFELVTLFLSGLIDHTLSSSAVYRSARSPPSYVVKNLNNSPTDTGKEAFRDLLLASGSLPGQIQHAESCVP